MTYIQQAIRTEDISLFKVDSPRLLHAAIGAVTEVAELLLAEEGDSINVKEEMGDILWYIAIACDELQLTFDELVEGSVVVPDLLMQTLLNEAGGALDVVKRGLYYGIEIDTQRFVQHFGKLLFALLLLAHDAGWTLIDLQDANIAKLTKRYPNKFNSEDAVHRDLEAEREAVGV